MLVDYVRWQRRLREARASGKQEPATPPFAPLSINLDLTTACNYACDHCIDWEILNSKSRHEDEDLRASLAQLAARGLRSVILIGGGEPTLYPGFADFVAYLKRLSLQVAVVSNGSRNDRVLKAAPSFTQGDWVRLSLDSGTNETFRRMHHPSNKSLSLDEICGYVPKIKAVNPALEVGFSFVITWKGSSRGETEVVENLHEIELAAERAEKSGFDYISFKPFLLRSEDGSEVLDPARVEARLQEVLARIRSGIDRARRLEREGFRVMESTNLRVLMSGNWREYTNQPRTCHMQMLRQVLTPLGTFNCPAHRGIERARVGGKTLWKSAHAGAERTKALLDGFDASEQCREVTCLYHSTNWWIEGLIRSSADPGDLPAGEERGDYFL
ncbi:MAG: hypothetical protein Fur0037_06590 [Planctomycetota bacterium]